MITINGTAEQHKELINWANDYNEKIHKFITAEQPDSSTAYPIIIMPYAISSWLTFNCHLGFIKKFYCNFHGIKKIPYGEEIK